MTLETNGGTVNTPYLPSTFCIFESQEKDGEKYFVITGGGFGHGIGMSPECRKCHDKTRYELQRYIRVLLSRNQSRLNAFL